MPPINHAALASVGIIAASVAVAAAIALYESPEVRRMTEDLRRRIAIALHSLGDSVGPNRREPRFNRPEDAEGFYHSHDVDADEETRRRQREELMYWNARREEQKRREREESQKSPSGSTFDDFLQPDKAGGESGSYVYNTGSNAWDTDSSNLLRRRGNADGVREFNAAVAADSLSSEHGIELDGKPWAMEEEHAGLLSRGHDEGMSDIYNATPLVRSPTLAQSQAPPQLPPTPPPRPAAESEVLFDFDHHSELHPLSEYATATEGPQSQPRPQPEPQAERSSTPTPTSRSVTLERELADDEYMTAGQDDRSAADAAYASIQAWAHNSFNTAGFYSPLPVSPPAPLSEPEIISEGQLTPTDSASVAGSGVDVAHDAVSVSAASGDDDYDVMSQTDSGMPTPNSWSEVGSVVSESESAVHA